MSEQAQAILEQAMKLPFPEREQLANQLMHSIDNVPLTDAEAETLDAEWAPEIRRRIAELESGTVKLVPWVEVRAELQALIGE